MRIAGLGCVLAVGLAAGGCFQMTTVVKVNGDGSGTIDHSMLVTRAALAQLQNFAAFSGGRSATVDLTSEDQARAMARDLGPGVTYVSSAPIETPLGRGRRAVYSFEDISQLHISGKPETPAGIRVPGQGLVSSDITCSFSREPNGNAVVHINIPELKPEDLPGVAGQNGSTQEPNPALAQQFAMVRALLAGARMTVALEPAGQLVRTNGPYVEGSRVTLLDVDVDQLLGNEELLARLRQATTPDELKGALKDVPGLKIPLEREITVEFK